ncbi:MAG TPA: hypothetical protein VMI31_12965 [Fimbriimonadaceae bacterium]|nr:hypothetical protein [Fimbriimonadaceae bacterium]
MEAPPPYRKKSNTGLIVGIVIGVVVVCCILPLVLGGGGILWLFKNTKGLVQCSMAYQDVRDALKDYAKDHDNKLPPAATWQDEVTPYYEKVLQSRPKKEQNPFGTMSASGVWGCDNGSNGMTGMAYNDDVAGKELSAVETSDDIVLFEIEQATRDAHQKYTKRPDSTGPKIFGSAPRGWFLIRMTGEPMLLNKGTESPISTGPKVSSD